MNRVLESVKNNSLEKYIISLHEALINIRERTVEVQLQIERVDFFDDLRKIIDLIDDEIDKAPFKYMRAAFHSIKKKKKNPKNLYGSE